MEDPPDRGKQSGLARPLVRDRGLTTSPRLDAVDVARGIAIVAMVVFHFAWDLAYLGFYGVDVTRDPGWLLFQRAILSSFMLLVGCGLVLGHGAGMRWPAFGRRLAVIAAAAGLVTLGTWLSFPDTFVYFGVLHAIALFSPMALPFLFRPAWAAAAAGAAVIAAAALVHHPLFMAKPLSWIGFWPESPPVNDLVPVFPWFGPVLLGIAGTHWLMAGGVWSRIAGWRARGAMRALAAAGRWSLLIYLVHQPLLLGALQWLPAPLPQAAAVADRDAEFAGSCRRACVATGGGAPYCQRYCACALEQVEAADMWAMLEKPLRSAAEITGIDAMASLCTAMAE
jgi:uncharacterized membrane protein